MRLHCERHATRCGSRIVELMAATFLALVLLAVTTPASHAQADVTKPTADIIDVTPDPRATTVDSVQISFSEPVTGVDKADVILSRNGASLALSSATLSGSGSSYTLSGLGGLTGGDGMYVLKLVATGSGIKDGAGNALAGDASDSWLMDTVKPDTSITSMPNQLTINTTVTFGFSGSDAGSGVARYECKLDTAAFAACSSPVSYNGLSTARHTFQVRAYDAAGSFDSTPASYSWTIAAPGAVVAWGANGNGQTTIPAGLTDVVAVAAGQSHSLALKRDGTLVAWGKNDLGQTNVPAGLSNVVAITAGQSYSLALKADGTLVAWGAYYNYGEIIAQRDVVAIDGDLSGYGYALAVKRDGTIVILNMNGSGDTPAQAMNPRDAVAAVGGAMHQVVLRRDGTAQHYLWGTAREAAVPDVIAIDAGDSYSVALKADGTIITWGTQQALPAGFSNIVAIAAGSKHGLALTGDGTVLAAGQNDQGQTNVPAGLANVTGIAAGGAHSLAIINGPPTVTLSDRAPAVRTTAADSVAISFTQPVSGIDANDFRLTRNGVPVALNGAILSGSGRTYALSGLSSLTGLEGSYTLTLVAQGAGIQNAVGNTMAIGASDSWVMDRTAPDTVISGRPASPTTSPVASFSFGGTDNAGSVARYECKLDGGTFAPCTSPLRYDGLVAGQHSFQVRAYDQAGLVDSSPASYSWTVTISAPGKVVAWGAVGQIPNNPSDVVAIAAGTSHSLALRSNRTVVAWDWQGSLPVPAGLSDVVAIAAGYDHSLALKSDGTVVAWGGNEYGQATVPAGLTNVTAIAAGEYHSVALRSDGTVVVWGVLWGGGPAGVRDVISIAAGSDFTLALKSDGTVIAWGSNVYGRSAPPAGLSDVIAISAGYNFSAALKRDGSIVAWGANGAAAGAVPAGLSTIVAIAAGSNHGLALRSDGSVVAAGQGAGAVVPAGLGNVTAIAAGYTYSLALTVAR